MTLTLRWQNSPVNRYYTINRILLVCIGLWPYQESIFRHITIAFTTITIVLGVVFQLTTFVTTEYNVDILLRVLAYSIPWIAYTLKYNVHCLNMRRMRSIMERILCDWNELKNVQEVKIIKEYADIGRLITLLTTLIIYIFIFCFIMVQLLSNHLLDVTSVTNESHPRQLPVLIECFIDQQKYFFLLLSGLCFIAVCGFTTVAATETLTLSYVQHACGLFEISSYRIEQALFVNTLGDITSPIERSSIICQRIISGFNMYQKAVEFVIVMYIISVIVYCDLPSNHLIFQHIYTDYEKFIEMIKKFCKLPYSIILPLGVISLSINFYRFSRLITSKEYYELANSFIFILGHFWYMFSCNYFGQAVIDHSSDVFHRIAKTMLVQSGLSAFKTDGLYVTNLIYNVQWYVAPLRAQKFLLLIMQRSMRHCTIVVDGLFTGSMEGFATLASTSISYFAVIFSLF